MCSCRCRDRMLGTRGRHGYIGNALRACGLQPWTRNHYRDRRLICVGGTDALATPSAPVGSSLNTALLPRQDADTRGRHGCVGNAFRSRGRHAARAARGDRAPAGARPVRLCRHRRRAGLPTLTLLPRHLSHEPLTPVGGGSTARGYLASAAGRLRFCRHLHCGELLSHILSQRQSLQAGDVGRSQNHTKLQKRSNPTGAALLCQLVSEVCQPTQN